jgi:phage gp29-like protein
MVIEWYDGRGAEVLAKVELIVPSDEDEKFYLESVNSLAKLGVRVSKDAVLERLGVQEAADDEVALGETQDFKMQDPRQEIANAMDPVALSEWIFEVRSALTTDLQPLGKALAAAMQTGDLPAMQAALKKISDGMPDLAGEAESLAEVLSRQFAKALTDDEPES